MYAKSDDLPAIVDQRLTEMLTKIKDNNGFEGAINIRHYVYNLFANIMGTILFNQA